jgi:Na+-transporting methylmalonyl-CoA/oxaloacetate decarboxylase gamma subunit
MAARLGHVLGWAGDILGGLLMLTGVYWGRTTDKFVMFLLFFLAGFVVFLIGRACRYVLAGEEKVRNRFANTSELIVLLVIVAAIVGWHAHPNPKEALDGLRSVFAGRMGSS